MDTAVINIKVEPALKLQVHDFAQELGLSVSSLIHALIKQAIRSQTVSLSLAEEPSDYLKAILDEARKDIKAGRVSPAFTNAKDAIAWLDSPKKKYANKIWG
ncbi:hypothetical protein HY085_00525 [Candidatus Gottesmanbacteria bacterium]|nr:hypothetical protein [Candidatus Gottesmanbacteria bacterium]